MKTRQLSYLGRRFSFNLGAHVFSGSKENFADIEGAGATVQETPKVKGVVPFQDSTTKIRFPYMVKPKKESKSKPRIPEDQQMKR